MTCLSCSPERKHVTLSSDQDHERHAYVFVSSDLMQQRNSQFSIVSTQMSPILTHANVFLNLIIT